MNFTEEQLNRYSRHILLQNVGVEGQIKLSKSKVLVIGAGGLGSPAAYYLAAAGVGKLGIVDADVVDMSNLQRQILHFTRDLDKPKIQSAKEKIEALNPEVTIHALQMRVEASNISDLIKDYDFIVDGTDNFPAKFLINDACVMAGIPYSHGGILRFQGQTMTVIPGHSACYRCIFRLPPPKDAVPTCSQAGVLGVIAGILGTIQATEALKHIIGVGTPLANTLLNFDATTMDFRKVKLRKDSGCPLCGDQPSITQLQDEEQVACDLPRG